MMDVPLIVTVECRAFAYLTPTRDRISPIRTGRRATTLVPRRLPSAVAALEHSIRTGGGGCQQNRRDPHLTDALNVHDCPSRCSRTERPPTSEQARTLPNS